MTDNTLKAQRRRAAKPMLWIGMASMVMAFAGLTSGYVVSRSSLVESGKWMYFEVPGVFTLSTVVILVSSIAMTLAVRFARRQKGNAMKISITITLLLGVLFAIFQFEGWNALVKNGVYFTGPQSNNAGSWFYAITWFHMAHLVSGLIVMIVTAAKAFMGKYSKGDYLGVEMAAIFWHFLDILWLYLFLFLSFIR